MVCGKDVNQRGMLKCYDIRTGTELDHAELKTRTSGIAEVKQAGRLSLAVACV